MRWITSSRFDAHLAPRLTRKVCQTVLLHDLIGSSKIFECCRTSRHRFLLRHSHQLSTRAQPTSLWQRTSSLPCATVFGCVSSGSCQERIVHQCLREDHSSTPTERDNQETRWVFWTSHAWKSTRVVRPSASLNVTSRPPSCWSRPHLLCGFQDQATVLFLLDTWSDRREAVHHCQEVHQLVSLWKTRNWLSHPWSNLSVPRLDCTRELRSCSVFVKDTTLSRLFQKADSFPQGPLVCFCLCLSCGSCLSAFGGCQWWDCRMLLHLVFSRPNVQFCHSSCTCWCLYCSCCLCCSCDFLSGFGVCICPSLCLSWESRLASCCHHPHMFHFQLTRSDSKVSGRVTP